MTAATSSAGPMAQTGTTAQTPNLDALEREVRADPVIQELMRMGGTELTEVRPLTDDEQP